MLSGKGEAVADAMLSGIALLLELSKQLSGKPKPPPMLIFTCGTQSVTSAAVSDAVQGGAWGRERRGSTSKCPTVKERGVRKLQTRVSAGPRLPRVDNSFKFSKQ